MTTKDIERFWSKVTKGAGCWVWQGAKNKPIGHGVFKLSNPRRQVYAHRTAWELERGPIPKGLHVCHTCDVPWCVNPDHLFLGTHLDNMADCVAKGRQASGLRNGAFTKPETRPRGERHGRAKLIEENVREIRRSYRAGATQQALADRFGVSQNQISLIVMLRSWIHVK